MTHEQAEELLARRDELTPREEDDLREHLAGCPSCSATAREYAAQANLLRSLPQVKPPAALRTSLVEHITPPSHAPVAHTSTAPRHFGNSLPPEDAVPLWRRDPKLYVLAVPLAAVFLLAAVGLAQLGRQAPAHNAAVAPPTNRALNEGTLPAASPTPTPMHHKVKATATPLSNSGVIAAQPTTPFQSSAPIVPTATTPPATARPTILVAVVGTVKPKPTPSERHAGGPVIAPIPPPPASPVVKPTPKPTRVITAGVSATATPVPTPFRTPVIAVPSAPTPAPSPTGTP